MKYPLTLRGTIVILAGAYLLLGPAKNSADLVSGIIGATFLLLGIFLAIVTIFGMLFIKARSFPTIFAPEEIPIALKTTKLITNCGPISVPPLFLLKTCLIFQRGDLTTTIHEIKGISNEERRLIEEINFPHRGNWSISGVLFSFEDVFGISKIKWTAPILDFSVRVSPAGEAGMQIPILSSLQRTGDDIEHLTERSGDPLDLKPYNPADGMRRILWKVFAKSGQLISRYPERAMTPEGKVIIYALAGENDDGLCSEIISYLKKLEELGLESYFTCSGSTSVVKQRADVLALMIDTVWESNWPLKEKTSLKSELEVLLSAVGNQAASISSVLIFCSEISLQNENSLEALHSIGSKLEKNGISPIFCIKQASAHEKPKRSSLIKRIFIENKIDSSQADELYPKFLKICSQANWPVIV